MVGSCRAGLSLGVRRLTVTPHSITNSAKRCLAEQGRAIARARPVHTDTTIHRHDGFRVHQFPILSDNYSYLIVDEITSEAVAVDPADPERTLAEVARGDLALCAVLCTHKHADHAQGNEALAAQIPGLRVVGPAMENCPAVTEPVSGGEHVQLFSSTWHAGEPIESRVLFTPYHTAGHVSFILEPPTGPAALFCGDSLFVGGCGRNFEGTAEQMYSCLIGQFAALDPNTAVYCGHEYTSSNLKFALSVEPDNSSIQDKMAWAEERRRTGLPTVPSTIGAELRHNVFMRCELPAVQDAVACTDAVSTMRELRTRKDNF